MGRTLYLVGEMIQALKNDGTAQQMVYRHDSLTGWMPWKPAHLKSVSFIFSPNIITALGYT